MLYHPLTSADGTPDEADWYLAEADLARPQAGMPAWRVSRRKLRGGRRDGVEVVTLDNGNLAVEIVPTRGMGLHRGTCGRDRLGWDSPVRDGPVNPQFIRLEDRGGVGWLDGFDELMVRCGLAHNGPPFETFDPPDGGATARRTMHPLHGRIANTPACAVGVEIDDGAVRTITVIGEVAESSLFHPQLHLRTEITTRPGSNRLTVRDTITNRSDQPGAFQLLYHWNFGPPYLGDGSSFHAPIAELSPRDPRAAEGIAHFATYGPPEPGFAEQAYLAHLVGNGPSESTLAMLVDPSGSKAVVLRFSRRDLPCFTLWKNTGGLNDGYVTGLEPGTNFPHPQAYEKARLRVVPLASGASYQAETTLEVLTNAAEVDRVVAEVATLQQTRPATIHDQPTEPFAPEG